MPESAPSNAPSPKLPGTAADAKKDLEAENVQKSLQKSKCPSFRSTYDPAYFLHELVRISVTGIDHYVPLWGGGSNHCLHTPG